MNRTSSNYFSKSAGANQMIPESIMMQQQFNSLPPLTKFVLNYVLEPMKNIDQQLDHYLHNFWILNGDKRSNRLPFMSAGPWKLLAATSIYLIVIKFALPKLMAFKRQPFDLKWLIRVYNLSMVITNLFAFYHGSRILNFGLKAFGCEIIDHSDLRPESVELLHYGWLFLLSRLIEWLDTIFFLLRKKQSQVTKLHLFHHSFVPILCWTYLKFHPGYTVAFFPLINTFVHTIMYSYYFLATFGAKIQPYLWWKKYLTSLQIAQFVLVLIQLATIPLSSNEKCHYPRLFLYGAVGGAALFLWLFFSYYLETYRTSSNDATEGNKKITPTLSKRIVESGGDSRVLSDAINSSVVKNNKFE